MPYDLNSKQYESIVGLDGSTRCAHFIGRVGDWQQLWAVRNDEGWLVPIAPDAFEYFPVWPHPEYAQRIADIHFPGHVATEIALDDFLESWLPRFRAEKVKVAVFPNENWGFWVMEPEDLLQALEEEAAQYE